MEGCSAVAHMMGQAFFLSIVWAAVVIIIALVVQQTGKE